MPIRLSTYVINTLTESNWEHFSLCCSTPSGSPHILLLMSKIFLESVQDFCCSPADLQNKIICPVAAENCGKEREKCVWKLHNSRTAPLTVMYEIYCLNISVWKHKVCLFISPEKTPARPLHSTGPVTEVAWYGMHVSYSVVNGVSSELCYSLPAKHTDCPLCVHNKCKTILHMVFRWHLELMEKI